MKTDIIHQKVLKDTENIINTLRYTETECQTQNDMKVAESVSIAIENILNTLNHIENTEEYRKALKDIKKATDTPESIRNKSKNMKDIIMALNIIERRLNAYDDTEWDIMASNALRDMGYITDNLNVMKSNEMTLTDTLQGVRCVSYALNDMKQHKTYRDVIEVIHAITEECKYTERHENVSKYMRGMYEASILMKEH